MFWKQNLHRFQANNDEMHATENQRIHKQMDIISEAHCKNIACIIRKTANAREHLAKNLGND